VAPLLVRHGSVVSTNDVGIDPPVAWSEAARHVLLVDTNTVSGATAEAAFATTVRHFPKAAVSFATLVRAYGSPLALEGVLDVMVGIESDELGLASTEALRTLDLRPGIPLFPWELAEHELEEVAETQRVLRVPRA
jgi:hypothetical protein